MKKILILVIALLVVAPVFAYAACDPTKSVCVVVADENDDKFSSDTNEDTGVTVKSFPVYVQQYKEAEVKSVTVTISEKSTAITNLTFRGVTPYEETIDRDKATFAVPEGTEGSKSTKILVGYVIVTVNNSGDDCSFTAQGKVNGVSTGAFVNYVALGAGVILLGGLYAATRSKKKMYNI